METNRQTDGDRHSQRDTHTHRAREAEPGVIYPLGPSGMACTWRQTSSTVEPGSSSSSWKGAWWKSSWSSSSLICSRARTLPLYSALVHLQHPDTSVKQKEGAVRVPPRGDSEG